jgi:hypothetical protein
LLIFFRNNIEADGRPLELALTRIIEKTK